MGWMVPASFSLLFFFAGVGFTFMGLTDIWRAARSAYWPTAAATITRSTIAPSGDAFTPHIEYQYVVDGVPFCSTRIQPCSQAAGSYRFARTIASRYPVGQAVTIAYDPSDPVRSALEPGLRKQSFGMLVAGLMFAGLGAGFTLLFWAISP